MPASAIIDIEAQKKGSGITETTRELRGLDSAMESVDGKAEKVFKRMERPLGRTVFAMAAESALGLESGVGHASGAMMALERGFHAAAMGAMMLGGPMASVALVTAGVLAIILKLNEAFNKNGEAIAKEVEEAYKSQDAMRANADSLLRLGRITKEQHDLLIRLSGEKTKQADEDIKLAETAMKHALARLEEQKILANSEKRIRLGIDSTKELKKAQDDYNKALETYNTAIGPHTVEAFKKSDEAKKKMAEAEKKRIEEMIQNIHHLEEAYNRHIEKMQSMAQKMSAEFQKYSGAISGNIKKINGQIVLDTAQMAADMVKTTATMLAEQLSYWGMFDILTGNVGKGVAELAGSAAISAAGGVAAAALGPDSGTGNSPALGSAASAGSEQQGLETTRNQMNLNVTIAGGIPDPHSITFIMDEINKRVQAFNGVMVASVVKPPVGQIPGT